MGERGAANLLGMPNTDEEAIGWPFALQRGSSSFVPTVHNSSWDRGKRPSDPNSERSHLQSAGLDHEPPGAGCIPYAFEGPSIWVNGVCNRKGVLSHCWAFVRGGWSIQGPEYNFEDYGLANWGQLIRQRFLGGHLDKLGIDRTSEPSGSPPKWFLSGWSQ